LSLTVVPQSSFRVSATGVVQDIDHSVQIVKKLKLTGTPYKIHKDTAFIRGMFNSSLEVAKFEGAKIRTVSGIRGAIKKAVSQPEGAFRAAFEDKILKSDIVFLRTWYPVSAIKYYNPVLSLLSPQKEMEPGPGWASMRTVREVREENGTPVPLKSDSEYRPVERMPRVFNPLHIPKALQAALPFASKPKLFTKRKRPTLETARKVVMEPQERRLTSILQQVRTIKNQREITQKHRNTARLAAYKKQKAEEEQQRVERVRAAKKRTFQLDSKDKARLHKRQKI